MAGDKKSHRLGRVFRKSSNKISTRDWNDASDSSAAQTAKAIEEGFGVSMATLKQVVAKLTTEEKARAALGQDPIPVDETAMQKRLERFGGAVTTTASAPQHDAAAAGAAVSEVDAETLRKRAERFGVQQGAGAGSAAGGANPVSVEELSSAIKKRMERFGTATTSTTAAAAPVALSAEDEAAMARRASRFAKP